MNKQLYSIEEIFEFAIKIETNGELFYNEAALIIPEQSEILTLLARDELNHKKYFTSLKDQFSNSNNQINNSLILDYLHQIVNDQVFDNSRSIDQLLNKESSLQNILEFALSREKAAILFFLGVKELLESKQDEQILNMIIKEELSHISIISNKLKNLNQI
jgi:rubrerythrin